MLKYTKTYTLMKLLLLTLILTISNTLRCQTPQSSHGYKDTLSLIVSDKDPFWKYTIAPTVFIGLSAATWHSREEVKQLRNRYTPNFRNQLDNYMQYAPAGLAFTLKIAGVKGRNKLGRSALNWAGGMLIMGGFVNSIKYTAKVMRPDGTTRNSFPSGHTATAFMNATFLYKEYAHVNSLYAILGYTMSSYTGVSRSLNNRHWISDILAGAGIGILSTELSYLIIDSYYKNKGDFFTPFDVNREIEDPSFVSVKFGESFYLDNLNSLGKLGLETAIEGAYFFNTKWGLGVELGFMHMPIGRESLDILEWDILPSDFIDPQMDIQSLGLSSLMIGGYYSKYISSKFILQAKMLAGIGFGIGGDINIRAQRRIGNQQLEINLPLLEYNIKNTPIVGTGASLTMMLAPSMGISLYVDYKYANPKTKISISKYYQDIEDKFLDSENLPIKALSGGLKLAFYFKN